MSSSFIDIKDILDEYSHEVQDAITNEAVSIAKDGAKKLRATSPKTNRNTPHRGKYAKGWTVSTKKGRGFVHCVIHNKTDYQLTHLLEKEHLTNNGGKYIPKQKHIEPVNDECCSRFERNTENIIKNGG